MDWQGWLELGLGAGLLLFLLALVCLVFWAGIEGLWHRTPWGRPDAGTINEVLWGFWRKAERQKAAALEAEVQAEEVDIWRPDPERTKPSLYAARADAAPPE